MDVVAPTPPMGWNSWDCYGTTVTQDEVLANATFMSEHLLEHGWNTIVVDIQWYEPTARAGGYNASAPVRLDDYGRQLPAVERFPSSADGAGFGPLAAAIHALGLKFGLHVMRGIPRRAVTRNLPVFGTPWTAREIADPSSVCDWNGDNVGLNHDHPGAQAYYDAQVEQFAQWGVDFVKVDDMLAPYHEREIEAYARAVERAAASVPGRTPMILSLSPGTALSATHVDHLRAACSMWRVSNDLWDRWEDVQDQFARMARWAPLQQPGSWADADMLPVGRIGIRAERGPDRDSRLTPDEQRSMMTLWCIARSPLMVGGDLPTSSSETIDLLRNDSVLDLLNHSESGREVLREGGLVVWTARGTGRHNADKRYAAVFWTGDEPATITLPAASIGWPPRAFPGAEVPVGVELWTGEPVRVSPSDATTGNELTITLAIPRHGVRLVRL